MTFWSKNTARVFTCKTNSNDLSKKKYIFVCKCIMIIISIWYVLYTCRILDVNLCCGLDWLLLAMPLYPTASQLSPCEWETICGDKDTHPCLSSVTQPHCVTVSWALVCPFLLSILFSDDTSNTAAYNSLAKTDREEGAYVRARREQWREIKEISQHEKKNLRWREGDNYKRKEMIYAKRSPLKNKSYKISIYTALIHNKRWLFTNNCIFVFVCPLSIFVLVCLFVLEIRPFCSLIIRTGQNLLFGMQWYRNIGW